MKKVLLFVVLAALLTVSGVFAQGGIQIIDPQGSNSSNVDYLDDVKAGSQYQIDDWGIINVVYTDQWDQVWDGVGYCGWTNEYKNGADSLIIALDITNLSLMPKNFLEKGVSVKAVYNDQFEINGWWYQDSNDPIGKRNCLKDPKNQFQIDPFYTGYYVFGAKVPDFIVNDSKPLRLEITLDGVELTYHIRK